MLEIKRINPASYAAWDHFVLTQAPGGVFLSTSWKQAVEKGYGHQTFYLAAYSKQIVQGVLPLVLIRPPWARARLVSLPFCDYGGILARDELTTRSLLAQAQDLAARLQAGLEIRAARQVPILQGEHKFVAISDKCRMLLRLPGSADLLWSGFKSKLRSQIRRPLKSELVAKLGSTELLSDFYAVLCSNMRDLGSPVHSRNWIFHVLSAFGPQAVLCVVYKQQEAVAAGLLLVHANTASIPWASALQAYNKLSPNMLLYWKLLEYAADQGLTCFDFGRSTPGSGTFNFKKQWGAEPEPLFWYRLGRGRAQLEKGMAFMRSTGEALWRRMPLVAASSMGPYLRKYISR